MIKSSLPGTSAIGDKKVPGAHNLPVPEFAGDRGRGPFRMVSTRIAKRPLPSSKKVLSTFLFLWLASCANQDDQFQKRMQEILLWSATAEMILNARLGALVPKSFTDLAVERCQKQIVDLASQLPQTSKYAEARANIVRLDRLIAAADDEIGRGRFEQAHLHLIELHQSAVELRRTSGADG
ncbi:hypothetical protein HFO92_26920 [Rhizobium leguminosarum]|nr:hypothetical protein [Rhizobium leguminosarum]MBY5370260.1 hypothetical protein [Rhizobium leguminosarum]